MNAIDYAIRAVGLIGELAAASVDVIAFVRLTETRLAVMRNEHRDPNLDEWSELNAQVEALRLQLHKPLNVQ